MDPLLKKLLDAQGISGYEGEIGALMAKELRKSCNEVQEDVFGNIIARKGNGKKKIMIAAHMDEVGLVVKHIDKDGFLSFVKVGGIDDRILVAQRVLVKSKKGDFVGVIGAKPPHLLREEEKKQGIKYDAMFIDIGCKNKEEAQKLVELGDPVIFQPVSGDMPGKLSYGKAIDNRLGCFALIKIMEKLKVNAQVFAVATAQEEVGLKGARTSSFKINPDFAIAVDTTVAGDMPGIKETESAIKLGQGVAITILEASGRGVIVSAKIKDMCIDEAKKNKIKYQIDVIDGGMTDGAMIYMNREGIPTAVLSIPSRYIHSPCGVFSADDIDSAVDLAVKVVERVSKDKQA